MLDITKLSKRVTIIVVIDPEYKLNKTLEEIDKKIENAKGGIIVTTDISYVSYNTPAHIVVMTNSQDITGYDLRKMDIHTGVDINILNRMTPTAIIDTLIIHTAKPIAIRFRDMVKASGGIISKESGNTDTNQKVSLEERVMGLEKMVNYQSNMITDILERERDELVERRNHRHSNPQQPTTTQAYCDQPSSTGRPSYRSTGHGFGPTVGYEKFPNIKQNIREAFNPYRRQVEPVSVNRLDENTPLANRLNTINAIVWYGYLTVKLRRISPELNMIMYKCIITPTTSDTTQLSTVEYNILKNEFNTIIKDIQSDMCISLEMVSTIIEVPIEILRIAVT